VVAVVVAVVLFALVDRILLEGDAHIAVHIDLVVHHIDLVAYGDPFVVHIDLPEVLGIVKDQPVISMEDTVPEDYLVGFVIE
jgi:hypothetical protein